MIERIKAHLDNLFDGVPRTRKIEDMYQELLAGCLDKYTDLTSGGMDSEEAYYKVIGGIGDVDELLGYVEKTETFNYSDVAEKRRKRAFFTSASICGYFIALSMLFLFMYNGRVEIGLALMVAFAGVSTMALIYGRMTNAVRYEKADDTLVEVGLYRSVVPTVSTVPPSNLQYLSHKAISVLTSASGLQFLYFL